MDKKLRNMWWAIEINLILWMVTLGNIIKHESVDAKWMAGVGLLLAAILQHWAYYGIYKQLK